MAQLVLYYKKFLKYYSDRLQTFEKFKLSLEEKVLVLQIPEFSNDISNLSDLEGLSDATFNN